MKSIVFCFESVQNLPRLTFKDKDPTGKDIEGRTEMTRKKMPGKS
jgi:hypothetical protein